MLAEFAAPLLQLSGHGLNACDLLNAHHLGPITYVCAESGFRQFNDKIRGVAVDVFAKPFQNLDGGSNLSGRRCVHNQMWIPREGLRGKFEAMAVPTLGQPFRALDCLRVDRICPRFTESESSGGFLGVELAGCFNHRAKWVAHYAGVFSVRVVDAPELVARRYSRFRAHADSSAQGARW
ncbi:MAG: hypothetical protein M5U12_28465 [Verrucomicrobia bacterium]|nr:hypothetical protein [Verrucomicrobiota bacterium]